MIARALETEIVRLYHSEHWPVGTIALQLRVHHATVRRVLAQAGVPVAQKIARFCRKVFAWTSRSDFAFPVYSTSE